MHFRERIRAWLARRRATRQRKPSRPVNRRWFWLRLIAGIAVGLGVYFWFTTARILQNPIRVDYGPDDRAFRGALGSIVGAAFVPGNSVQTLVNGVEFIPAMVGAIHEAKKSVTLESYIWSSGRMSDQFIAALTDRARNGVKVHVIVDGMGSPGLLAHDPFRVWIPGRIHSLASHSERRLVPMVDRNVEACTSASHKHGSHWVSEMLTPFFNELRRAQSAQRWSGGKIDKSTGHDCGSRVSRIRHLTAWLLLAFWVPATQLCALEMAGVLRLEDAHEESCCGGNVCCAENECRLLDGATVRDNAALKVFVLPVLTWVSLIELHAATASLNEDAKSFGRENIERPKNWIPRWQFVRRAALMPRAPSSFSA